MLDSPGPIRHWPNRLGLGSCSKSRGIQSSHLTSQKKGCVLASSECADHKTAENVLNCSKPKCFSVNMKYLPLKKKSDPRQNFTVVSANLGCKQ